MAETALKFFQSVESSGVRESILVQGENPLLRKRLRDLLRRQDWDLEEIEMRKGGPHSELEDSVRGTSLFASKKAVLVSGVPAPSTWTSGATKLWERILECLGNGVVVVCFVHEDRRIKWSDLGLKRKVNFSVEGKDVEPWLEVLAREQKFQLDAVKREFLLSFGEDLLTYFQWLELWSLGGDIWAEKALGWKGRAGMSRSTNPDGVDGIENPAYAWVDAVLRGQAKRTLLLEKKLFDEESSEPLQLLGLLSKSLRILSHLENALSLESFPPFLVEKMRLLSRELRTRGSSGRLRSEKLLKFCSEMDFHLKTRPSDAGHWMQRLASL